MLNKLFEICTNHKAWVLLIIISSVYITITFFSSNWIYTDDYFYRNLSTQLPSDTIDAILKSNDRFWWTGYLLQVVIVLSKVLFAALCIFIGVVLADIEFSFTDLFRSVVMAEFIFIIAQAIFISNLFVNRSTLTLETTANYFPLSMLSYLGVENVVPWLHYPLQTLNLFEVAYVLCIAWLLSKQWKPDFVESLNIVIPSYGLGLLVWMVLVVFLTLQVS